MRRGGGSTRKRSFLGTPTGPVEVGFELHIMWSIWFLQISWVTLESTRAHSKFCCNLSPTTLINLARCSVPRRSCVVQGGCDVHWTLRGAVCGSHGTGCRFSSAFGEAIGGWRIVVLSLSLFLSNTVPSIKVAMSAIVSTGSGCSFRYGAFAICCKT